MSSMLRMTSSLPPLLADLARTKSWSGLQTTTQVPSLLRMTPPENRFPAFRTSLSEERPGESESYRPLRSDPILILYLANRNLYTGSNGANNVFSFLTSDGSRTSAEISTCSFRYVNATSLKIVLTNMPSKVPYFEQLLCFIPISHHGSGWHRTHCGYRNTDDVGVCLLIHYTESHLGHQFCTQVCL